MDLKKLRFNLRLSQGDLAELFKCNPSNISNIEGGKRNITALQIRLLIVKFGYEEISKYAEPGEMPQGIVSTIDRSAEIKHNVAPVQNGDGNSISTDATLIQVMTQQSDQISELIRQQSKQHEQMDRLISLLEKK